MIPLSDPALLRSQAYIGGAWCDDDNGRTFDVKNPANGELIATVPDLAVPKIALAVEAAHRAFGPWRKTTAQERSRILRAWFALMITHKRDLATILTHEQGKPVAEAEGEIAYAASFIEWFAEEAKRVYGDITPSPGPAQRILTLKEPVGPCAIMTPWNFPAAMITRKVGPALAAGCTVVVKPASETPLTALALAVLAERAGVPRGVLNVVTGDAAVIADVLVTHADIRKVSFTGSTRVGKMLMEKGASTLKRMTLELGGNAPFVVFADADMDAAVTGAMQSKFRNMGQTCVCANRFLVHESIAAEFASRLADQASDLVVGFGMSAGVEQGPLIHERAVRKVEESLAEAKARGARIVLGGRRHERGGTFFEPTVVERVTPQMKLFREETFGPVAPVTAFSSDEDAIRLANDTEFGLASYMYTRDLARAFRVAEALDYGMVGLNTGLISNEVAPFGGRKDSGFGREGSRHGIEPYLDLKYLCLGGLTPA